MWQSKVRILDVTGQGSACTSEIVSVTSMLPVLALSTRRRKAFNLSVDGSLMSDFGLYRSHVEGTSRGKVTSVCRGKSTMGVHYERGLPSYLEKSTLCPLCEDYEADIRREREFAEGKFVGESLCAYHFLYGSHVQHAALDQFPLLYSALGHEHRCTVGELEVARMQVFVYAFGCERHRVE